MQLPLHQADPTYLNQLAISQSAEVLTSIPSYESEVSLFNKLENILRTKYDINLDNNTEVYDAVTEMIVVTCFDGYSPVDRYKLNLAPSKVDENIFCLGNMLSQLDSGYDIEQALKVVNDLMPSIGALIEEAKKCPDFFIDYSEKVKLQIAIKTEEETAEKLLVESRTLYFEHLLEEAIADGLLSISPEQQRQIVEALTTYEQCATDLMEERIKLDKVTINELLATLAK